MSQYSLPTPFVELRTPPALRATALFGIFFVPVLLFIAWMAWWVEGAVLGLWTLPLWMGMELYWLWQWRVWAQRMRLHGDHLEILMPFAPTSKIAYDQIQAIHLAYGSLQIVTEAESIHLRGDANTLAQLTTALERRLSELHLSVNDTPTVPLLIRSNRQQIVLVNLFGLLIGALGISLLKVAFDDVEMKDRGFAIGFGWLMIGLAGAALYWLLVPFVWHYRFGKEHIEVKHSIHTESYDVSLLRKAELQQRSVTSRGITKTLYTLELQFANGRKLIVQPGAQNYPFEYAETYENVRLIRLLAQLHAIYSTQLQSQTISALPRQSTEKLETKPVESPRTVITIIPLDVAALPWPETKTPDYAYQLHSQPVDLTVTVVNYGERQPGAETVHLRLSRPVAGVSTFDTTNGVASFSQSGNLLLLHTLFSALVIDCRSMNVWRYTVRNRALFLDLVWEGEQLRGSVIGYGKSMSEAESFGPWSLEEIMQQWQAGLGQAEQGNLV
ncbi:MAG: hypothetical protein U0175_12700 [Caldilineaceae bacterium]